MSVETDPGSAQPQVPAPTTSSTASTPPPSPRRRWSLWSRLGIQSKLLTMLLVTSILSALVTGYFGYRSGSSSLRADAVSKVVAVRDARTREMQSLFLGLQRSLILNSLNSTSTDAMTAFSRDFRTLQSHKVTPAERTSVTAYYDSVFLPQLRKNVTGEVSAQSFLPRSPAQWYLQSKYTAPHKDFDAAIKVSDAGDGSAWSADHSRYHDFFRQVVERNGFEDAMLLDTEGNVVYTAYKGVDLGTNLLTGPYKDSGLEAAYRKVLRSNAVDAFSVTDFEPYTPSGDSPAAFGLSSIGKDGKLTGVLVVQLPIDAINKVMTTGGDWEGSGSADTGETYLVGPDGLMRSTSRKLVQDPKEFRSTIVDQGTSTEVADEIVGSGDPIGRLQVASKASDLALRGKTGTLTETDYLGRTVITSYAPAKLAGLNWAVIGQEDESEALAPVNTFLRDLSLALVGLVLLVVVASLLLARAFSRPVQRLVDGVRRVAAGDYDARVEMTSHDEFAQLAGAFNDMATSLRTKQDLLDDQLAENERMLLTLMPQPVAERFRGGEENITDEHRDVSVLYAAVDGLDDLGIGRTPEESIALLNELFSRLESTADNSAVERVRTLRSGFMVSSGLTVPRVDHAVRVVDFAREMWSTVERFNGQYDTSLSVRAGIDSGGVTTGLVGGSSLYDMWGDSVNLAYSVQGVSADPGIYLSQNVYDRVRDSYRITNAGTVTVKGVDQVVWQLDTGASRG